MEHSSWFGALSAIGLVTSFSSTLMFTALGSFFNRISDPGEEGVAATATAVTVAVKHVGCAAVVLQQMVSTVLSSTVLSQHWVCFPMKSATLGCKLWQQDAARQEASAAAARCSSSSDSNCNADLTPQVDVVNSSWVHVCAAVVQ
jgi:hypothetical protein